jgi:hypothetical protein
LVGLKFTPPRIGSGLAGEFKQWQKALLVATRYPSGAFCVGVIKYRKYTEEVKSTQKIPLQGLKFSAH